MAVAESHMRERPRSGLLSRARSPSPDTIAVLAIVVIVLLANFPYLSGLFDANPMGRLSGIGVYAGFNDPNPVSSTAVSGLLGGVPAIDPSNGPVSQALGHLAALDWTHLQVPWWNPYEGTGLPLAAELQSAAFFPPTLLLLMGNGQVYEHLMLELLAGIFTYLLLRRISVGRWASAAGGVAFALNGTFAWFQHAPANPVAFLPLLLLGIELAFGATTGSRRGGWWLIAVSLALLIYAGFVETAYIGGLLAVFWFAWRCGCAGRERLRAFATKTAVGGIVGLLLAAPLLVPFLDYTAHSYLAGHSNGYFGTVHIPLPGLSQLVLPYVYGSIYQFYDVKEVLAGIWGTVGGYLSASLLFFGMLGLASRGRQGLRWVLLAWIVLVVARIYGEPPVLGDILGVLPEMSNVAFFRYATPALELPVVVLAAIGLDGLITNSLPRRRVLAVAAGALLVVGLATLEAVPLVNTLIPAHHLIPPHHRVWLWAWVAWAVLLIAVGGIAVFVRRARARALLAAAIVCLDATVLFVIPELSAPRNIFIDTVPATFLQRHLGLSRYFTLGPLGPEYGSYFGVREVNVSDNPVSSVYANFVTKRLSPTTNPDAFIGTPGSTVGATPTQELLSHLNGYRAAGVRYVLAPLSTVLPQGPKTFRLVLRTQTTAIYRLAGTEPYFKATSAGCVVTPHGAEAVSLSCSRATTLIRHETYMPGWSAEVDGHPTPVREYNNAFQAVTVPRGTHRVTFGYAPRYVWWILAAFIVGCISLVFPLGWARARGYRLMRGSAANEQQSAGSN